MYLEQIKQAIEKGHSVFWANTNYRVIKDSIGQYLIHSQCNDVYWGLTHRDGITMNGKPEQFFSTHV